MSHRISRAERGCIFCGGKPLSSEHAIPAWIGETLHAMEPPGADWETHYQFGTPEEVADRRHGAPDNRPVVRINAACQPCNNGWMADLESAVAPILKPLTRGHSATLDLRTQLLVATWATKTALVMEFMRSDLHVASTEVRAGIRELLRPPSTFRVRLAQIDDPTRQPLRLQSFVGASEAAGGAPDALCTTLSIGHLVVQVWGGDGTGEVDLTKPGPVFPNAVVIWPPMPGSARWPPRVPLNEETLEDFMREPFPHADTEGFLSGW